MTERSAAVKSAWAEGVTYFAVALLITTGIFQVLQGLAAVLDKGFYVAAAGNVFALNVTAWGWIHLVIGILAVAIGIGLFYGRFWARGAGMGIAVFQAIVQFMFLPVLPRLVDRHHRPRRGDHLGAGDLPLRPVHVPTVRRPGWLRGPRWPYARRRTGRSSRC